MDESKSDRVIHLCLNLFMGTIRPKPVMQCIQISLVPSFVNNFQQHLATKYVHSNSLIGIFCVNSTKRKWKIPPDPLQNCLNLVHRVILTEKAEISNLSTIRPTVCELCHASFQLFLMLLLLTISRYPQVNYIDIGVYGSIFNPNMPLFLMYG